MTLRHLVYGVDDKRETAEGGLCCRADERQSAREEGGGVKNLVW